MNANTDRRSRAVNAMLIGLGFSILWCAGAWMGWDDTVVRVAGAITGGSLIAAFFRSRMDDYQRSLFASGALTMCGVLGIFIIIHAISILQFDWANSGTIVAATCALAFHIGYQFTRIKGVQ